MANKTDIKDLTTDQLISWLEDHHIEPYRANQIFKWIYLRQADRFEQMTDIKKETRSFLENHFTIDRLTISKTQTSTDGSRKFLFRLRDGNYIESVLIPEKDHYTLCISSQVGCAQGCKFCMTARGGFTRNLSAGEILAQVRDIAHSLRGDLPLSNIVLMGMGEPLANYRNVINAISILTNNDIGLRFSRRRVTLSTAGIVPKLIDLGRDSNVSLAISLNATDNKTRGEIMPINHKYPMELLLEACRNYPLKPTRRITFEYILIKDLNDHEKNAIQLAKLLTPIKSKINLIPFNEFEGSEFRRPDEKTILKFQEILHQKNYTTIIRQSKGQDISAACGQLRALAPDR